MATPTTLRAGATPAGTTATTPAKTEAAGTDAFLALLSAANAPEVVQTLDSTEDRAPMDAAADAEEAAPDALALLFGGMLPTPAATPSPALPAGSALPGEAVTGTADAFAGRAQREAAWLASNDLAPTDMPPLDDALVSAALGGNETFALDDAATPEVLRQFLQSPGLFARDAGADTRAVSGNDGNNSLTYAASGTQQVSGTVTATAATAPAPDQALRQHVGTPRWADELGSRLVMMSTRGQQEGSLTLTPEHLGPLEVRISLNQNTANVWFGAQQADTRSALTEALPRLREMFADAGLSLGQADVSHQAPRQDTSQPATRDLYGSAVQDESAPVETRPNVRAITRGLVDLYA